MRLVIALVAITALSAVGQESQPVLLLDPGGHTSIVKDLAFTPGGSHLVSVGDDKVVRLWDLNTGETIRQYHPPIGQGHEGRLFSLAVSPDGRRAAVSGYGFTGGRCHIWVFDLVTGQVVQCLKGHADVISALAYNPTGTMLASGSNDLTIRFWDTASGAQLSAVSGPTREIYDLEWSPDGQRLAAACFDGTALVYATSGPGPIILRGHTAEVGTVAWVAGGTRLVTGSFDSTVRLWDPFSGALISTTPQPSLVGSLAAAPDGRLACSLGAQTGENSIRIWLPDGTEAQAFRNLPTNMRRLQWSPNARLLAAADVYGAVQLWDTATGQPFRRLAGTGAMRMAVAWSADGQRVAWGERWTGTDTFRADSEVTLSFEPGAAAPGPAVGPEPGWIRAVTQRGTRSLAPAPDLRGVIITDGGRELGRTPPQQYYDVVRTASWTAGGDVVVGAQFTLRQFDVAGRLRREFLGHTADVYGVACSPDGRYVVSAGGDQTVRLWPLAPPGPPGAADAVGPLLSIFTGFDGQWVAWTPEGYYACSPGGEQIIGWQVNRGLEAAAEYYPAYQFRNRFYRPDVIAKLLSAGSVAAAVVEADQARRGTTDKALVASRIEEFAPPSVAFLSPSDGLEVTSQTLSVRAKVADPNGLTVRRVELLLNGRNETARALRARLTLPDFERTIQLVPGENRITLIAVNEKDSESVPVTVTVTYRPPAADPTLPAAYVLAVGVTDYGADIGRLPYAAKDAQDLARAVGGQQGKQFREVNVRLLTDSQAAQGDLLDGLDWMKREVTARDTAIVFLAGHGVPDNDGQFYYLPHGGDPDRLLRTALKWSVLMEELQRLPGTVMLCVDTCHAAGVTGGTARALRPRALTDALRQASATDVGLITFASCLPNEVSLERDDWGNGAFTKALVEALEGKADANTDGLLMLAELEVYVLERVKDLTEGRQHPSLTRPPTIPGNLALARTP